MSGVLIVWHRVVARVVLQSFIKEARMFTILRSCSVLRPVSWAPACTTFQFRRATCTSNTLCNSSCTSAKVSEKGISGGKTFPTTTTTVTVGTWVKCADLSISWRYWLCCHDYRQFGSWGRTVNWRLTTTCRHHKRKQFFFNGGRPFFWGIFFLD